MVYRSHCIGFIRVDEIDRKKYCRGTYFDCIRYITILLGDAVCGRLCIV